MIGNWTDTGGCLISTEALALIKHLGLKPRRSMQAILWTCEEAGLYGAADYVRHNEANIPNIIAAFESDGGTFTPKGLDFAGASEKAGCIINEILKLTESINTTIFTKFDSDVSTDISYLTAKGVPSLSLNNANDDYFFYHHSEADTMTMMNSADLDKGMALWAVASYIIADLTDPLPRTADVK